MVNSLRLPDGLNPRVLRHYAELVSPGVTENDVKACNCNPCVVSRELYRWAEELEEREADQ